MVIKDLAGQTLLETPMVPACPTGLTLPRVVRFSTRGSTVWLADVATLYHYWESPVAIVVDGPYGVGGFPGDPPTPEGLAEWYEPHVAVWSRRSTPQTTLWFWNTELGWANVHPVLVKHGWEYRCAHVWDKGVGHIAGNANSKSLRKLPVVSEICVQSRTQGGVPRSQRSTIDAGVATL